MVGLCMQGDGCSVHHELFRWRAEVRESGERECVDVDGDVETLRT